MDELEGDFQFYYHTDLRDFFRPGGGVSRLTLRRLMVLVARLPPESAWASVVADRPAVSEISAAVMDLWSAWHDNTEHPRWKQLQRARERAEFEAFVEEERALARSHNTIYLQARKATD